MTEQVTRDFVVADNYTKMKLIQSTVYTLRQNSSRGSSAQASHCREQVAYYPACSSVALSLPPSQHPTD